MNKKLQIIIIFFNIFFLLILTFLLFSSLKEEDRPKIVYLDNVRLFNQFNMSKDLNNLNRLKINGQKKKLDSLYERFNFFQEEEKFEESKKIEGLLRIEDQKLKEMVEFLSDDIGEQVWKRLNTYIKEYGKSNNYDIIIGTLGDGNVMYANSKVDITSDVLEYSNRIYEGTNNNLEN